MTRLVFAAAALWAGTCLGAPDAAGLIRSLPEGKTIVVATSDVGPLLDRAERAVRNGLLPPQSALARRLLLASDKLRHVFAGPAAATAALDAGREDPVVLLAVKPDVDAREACRQAFGELADAAEAGPGAFSGRAPGGQRFFARVRDGVLAFASDANMLKAVGEDGPRRSAQADFFIRHAPAGVGVSGVGDMVLGLSGLSPAERTAWTLLVGDRPGMCLVSWVWTPKGETVDVAADLGDKPGRLVALPAGRKGGCDGLSRAPASAQLLAGLAFDDGRALSDALAAVMAAVDPRIRDEFRQELAEYNRDAGMDFERDVLARVTRGVSYVVTTNEGGRPAGALVAGCRESARLKDALAAMARLAAEPWEERDGCVVTRAFAMPLAARLDDKAGLRVAASPDALDALDRATAAGTLAALPGLKGVAEADPGPAAVVWLRPSGIEALLPEDARRQFGLFVKMMTANIEWALVTARSDGGLVRLRLQLTLVQEDTTEALLRTAGGFVMRQARQAEAVRCMSNLRQLGLALTAWGADHGDRLPDDLAGLTPNYLAQPLACPNGPYLYLGKGVSLKGTELHQRMVACCPAAHPAGNRNLLFLDGHVQAAPETRAVQEIEKARRVPAQALEKQPGLRWKHADPYDADAAWLAFDWGVARVAGGRADEFRNLMGEEQARPTAITFTKDGVWVGTERGLFVWDRQKRFWARMAVGGGLLSPHVESLKADGGRIEVVIRADGGVERHVFNLDARAWAK